MVSHSSATGDPLTDALVPVAQRLIGAVRDYDEHGVNAAFADAEYVVGRLVADPWPELPATALALLVAAMVPVDQAPTALLRWVNVANEYQRLVDAGVGAPVASFLAASVNERKESG